ncbi:MAG TPA: molybdopterin dinucleotide binding domain-containing protein [Rhodopila sp.]
MGFVSAFSYASPADIFAEHAALSAFENDGTRAFDIGAFSGVDQNRFDRMPPFQWPRPNPDAPAETRFFDDGQFFTSDRKARFVPISPIGQARTNKDFPLVLNTGRVRDHWHTMTRTGKSHRLSQHLAEPFAEIHPEDAVRYGIADSDIVSISTASDTILVRALLSDRQARGSIFVPIHWTDQFAAKARVDVLVHTLTDPHSGQPASKHVPVRMERFAAALYGFAVIRQRPLLLEADYWALAKCQAGWRVEFAFAMADRDWSRFAATLFGCAAGADFVAYHDVAAGQQRFAYFGDGRLAGALFLAPEPVVVSREWAIEQVGADLVSQRARVAVVAARPGRGLAERGATVCSCFGVGSNQIAAAAKAGCVTVEAIGQALQAGTNCGSCRAEIKGIINAYRLQAAE